jgi:outer membrane murein-binding lipoprotein Lpp
MKKQILLLGFVTSLLVYLASCTGKEQTQKLEKDISELKSEIVKLEQKIDQIYKEIYALKRELAKRSWLKIGEEFLYQGKKIILKKYEILQCDNLAEKDKKELFIYLYVENIDDKSRYHVLDINLYLYANGKKYKPLLGFIGGKSECDTRRLYSIKDSDEIYPGEIYNGWLRTTIPLDWKLSDLKIHFDDTFGTTQSIWKLE